ncbi:MAG: hypothetical protein KGQ41_09355 [Alphaproteobacteria bacterium]|nr:hypothetical protein [Alphaproteobacteria bacterium]
MALVSYTSPMTYQDRFARAAGNLQIRATEGYRMLYLRHVVGERSLYSRSSRACMYNGQTAFYRSPSAHAQIMELLAARPSHERRVLVVAGSIGCQPYTLAMMAANAGLDNVRIDTFDISHVFMRVAREGVYPVGALAGLPPELVRHFNIPADGGYAAVSDDIKARVNFLPHSSLQKFKADAQYDVVVAENLLKHIYNNLAFSRGVKNIRHARQNKQAAAITQLCNLTRGYLFVDMVEETPFAFHRGRAPFNPFAEAGMVYLDARLQPFDGGVRYPTDEKDVVASIKKRDYIHALMKAPCL